MKLKFTYLELCLNCGRTCLSKCNRPMRTPLIKHKKCRFCSPITAQEKKRDQAYQQKYFESL